MPSEKHSETLLVAKEIVEKFGFRSHSGTSTFPWIATNADIALFLHVVTFPIEETVDRVNGALAPIYFKKLIGSLSRNMFALIFVDGSPTELQKNLIENDTHICRKFTISIGEGTKEELERQMHFLKPFVLIDYQLTPANDIGNFYVESLREYSAKLEPQTIKVLEKAFKEKWEPMQVVKALEAAKETI